MNKTRLKNASGRPSAYLVYGTCFWFSLSVDLLTSRNDSYTTSGICHVFLKTNKQTTTTAGPLFRPRSFRLLLQQAIHTHARAQTRNLNKAKTKQAKRKVDSVFLKCSAR